MKRRNQIHNKTLHPEIKRQGVTRHISKILSAALLLSIFAFMSCNEEEFLDKKPHTATDNSFYTTESGAEQGINAAYDILQLGESIERCQFAGTVCSGDAMAGGEPGGNDQPALQQTMKFTNTPTSTYSLTMWSYLYRGIYRCNLVIGYIGEPIEGFDEALRTRILGEAYFLRGYMHFLLQVTFGGEPQLQKYFNNQLKGVPFIDHVLLQEEWNATRPELSYTWGKIEEDFIKASSLLPVAHDATNIGRATQGAAKAMLAKTYLYQEKWNEAYNTAKEVINSGNYWLMGETGHNGPFTITRLGKVGEFQAQVSGYKYIWQPEANNCAESIFDVQHRQTGSSTFPEGQEGNLVPQYYGVRAVQAWRYDAINKVDVLEVQEYFWGFMLPTKYFVETAFRDNGCMENGKIMDPRYKLSVITAEDKVPYYYSNEKLRAAYPDSVYIAPYYNNPATGRVTWKYFNDPMFTSIQGSLGDAPHNTKMFRFADLLLIGAEAAVKAGQTADALTWINRVRDRARNAGNTGYPKALTAVTVEDVWAERRVELAFEGHQFWDIVRTGRAEKVLKQDALQYQYTENSGLTIQEQFGDAFQIGKHEIWPLPEAEINNTNGSITQNPGW